jgi:hypothetical protein
MAQNQQLTARMDFRLMSAASQILNRPKGRAVAKNATLTAAGGWSASRVAETGTIQGFSDSRISDSRLVISD